MADKLNKNRMLYTRVLTLVTLLFGVVGASRFEPGSAAFDAMRLVGYVLLAFCAMGRLYATAFIGGVKNRNLITTGPYSVCRNPLYFFSLCGAAGVGFATTSLVMTAFIFFGFLIIYISLITREEQFLQNKFGKEFATYKARTPRLLPNMSRWHAPAELAFQPKYLYLAFRDAIWWFAPLPLFALGQMLHDKNIFQPLLVLP